METEKSIDELELDMYLESLADDYEELQDGQSFMLEQNYSSMEY